MTFRGVSLLAIASLLLVALGLAGAVLAAAWRDPWALGVSGSLGLGAVALAVLSVIDTVD